MRVFPLLVLLCAACGGSSDPPLPPLDPKRIVSLDLCSDLYVLGLADSEAIAGLSPQSASDDNLLQHRALGMTVVRPTAEDILLQKPDLVIRSYGGGPRVERLLKQAGIPVVNVGWPQSLPDVAETVRRVGIALGNPQQGEQLAITMDREFATSPGKSVRALYLTPSGTTTGPGSLIHDVIEASGAVNFETRPGWRSIPLEQIVRTKPDHVITAYFRSDDRFEGRWDTMRHPIAQDLLDNTPRTDLPGALVSCSAWPLAHAIAAIEGDLR